MKKTSSKWKIIVPLVAMILVMTAAFFLISYQTYKMYEMEDLENYAKGLTDLIRKVFGKEYVYRIGGDEFVVILEGKAQDSAEERIRSFKDEIARLQADDSLKPWEKVSAAVGLAKYEKGQIIPNSEKLIEFANAYNVNVLDLLKSYNTPEMKFNAFRKKQRLQGQNLELLKEIIQNNVADYLEVIELNKTKSNNIKLKRYLCNSFEDAESAADKFRKDYNRYEVFT